MDSSQPRGRILSAPQSEWKDDFSLSMKPGETREVEVDTKLTATAGKMYTMTMRPGGDSKFNIAALQFSVISNPSNVVQVQQPQQAAAPATPAIDPAKPVKFVTQTTVKTPAAPGQSAVQAAVIAGLKASKTKTPAPAPAANIVAQADTKLP